MSLASNDSSSNLLVSYGAEDSEEEGELIEAEGGQPEEQQGGRDSRPPSEPTGTELLSLGIPDDDDEDDDEKGEQDVSKVLEGQSEVTEENAKERSGVRDGEVGTTIADISEDEDDHRHGARRHSESVSLRDSFTSEPETALTQKIRKLSADQVTLPPEPKGRCSKKLQEKIASYYRKNINMNASIQNRKDFRNPSIYEKLISYLGIDELGTNYPKDVFNPHGWGEESYYESLAKAQKEEMAKREKEKKERTKVEFVSGVAKKPKTTEASVLPDEERKRKTKWDAPAPAPAPPSTTTIATTTTNTNPGLSLLGRPQVAIITTAIINPTVVSTTVSATGTKTTVISAVGTIKKPKLEKAESVDK